MVELADSSNYCLHTKSASVTSEVEKEGVEEK